MPLWLTATAAFFLYIAAVAAVRPGVPRRRRLLVWLGSALGLGLALASRLLAHPFLDGWMFPPAALLLGYWTSGLLFVRPMPRLERLLMSFDCRLRVGRAAAGVPRPLAECLELAYAIVYPVVPAALIVHLFVVGAEDADYFWSVVLVSDYVCFGMLPWIQTRPPRALEPGEPWRASFRRVNLHLLGRTSIEANTFPSGHAAEGLAAALLVLGAPAAIVAAFFALALAISAGAVLGRYHYAADALAGWTVALAVWLAV